jgi:hypothetical protein
LSTGVRDDNNHTTRFAVPVSIGGPFYCFFLCTGLAPARLEQAAAPRAAGGLSRAAGGLRWGGGGGVVAPLDGESPPEVADPGAPATPAGLSLGAAGIKTLNFQWNAVDGATHYQLLEDLDGAGAASSPVAISTSIATTQYSHEVPLYTRLNASYTLRACNALGCSASSPAFAPSIANLNAAIGYAKATGGGTPESSYGAAIALSKDGQTLAVGAPEEDTGAPGSGAVFVMRRTAAGVWTLLPMLKDNSPDDFDGLGTSLALSADGSVLAIGVPGDRGPGGIASGSVRMYRFDAATQAYIGAYTVRATNADDGDEFGAAVALSDDGDVLAVGAPGEQSVLSGIYEPQPDDDSKNQAGAAYVYWRSGVLPQWTGERFIKAINANEFHRFGAAVALSGNGLTLAVGAPRESGGGNGVYTNLFDPALSSGTIANSGAVYVYSRDSVDIPFSNQIYIKSNNPDLQNRFGSSLALSENGSVLAVGEIGESTGGVSAGAVYVFARTGEAWSQQGFLKASNGTPGARFGASVALSSDGTTLAVGASGERRAGTGLGADLLAEQGYSRRGAVYVFRSVASTWSQSTYIKSPTAITDPDLEREFGAAVALSGDASVLAVGNPTDGTQSGGASNPQAGGAPAEDIGAAEGAGAVYLF